MERLTFESDGYFAVSADNCYEDQNENYCGPAIERLAVYEGTGLAPADVVDLMGNHAMAICELAMVPKWIPVAERLPKSGERVLATDGVVVGEMYFAITKHWHRYNGISWKNFADTQITHWMPLPAAPGMDGA